MSHFRDSLRAQSIGRWVELPRSAPTEFHFVIADESDLQKICAWAKTNDYYLCTITACDERLLEDNVFKFYIVLSSPSGHMVILEYPLALNSTQYLSIRDTFRSSEPLEMAARDLFGLVPVNEPSDKQFWLHAPYPTELYPLRKTRTIEQLMQRISAHQQAGESADRNPLPYGTVNLVVGPIHAGIIEPGQFRFFIAGEVVEDLEVNLGYKHRGIEKLFETNYTLADGQKLAERISGDSSFAHSMAYCQAVENLANQHPSESAQCWRGFLLEVERLYNHIGDVGALVHDVAFDLIASEFAAMREQLMRINVKLTKHRLLRGVNFPGGVRISLPAGQLSEVSGEIQQIVESFLELVSQYVLSNSSCRNRYLTTGVLTREEAWDYGSTGVPARASGFWQQDFRIRHPYGVYCLPGIGNELRELVASTILDPHTCPQPSASTRRIPAFQNDLNGDAFARLLVRIAEVETSSLIIKRLTTQLLDLGEESLNRLDESVQEGIERADNFDFGLGYVEGWRGDIFYFVMKGPNGTIFRCHPRDPSLFNWPALQAAVKRKQKRVSGSNSEPKKPTVYENILADFPVINKSFNLSYAGQDG